MIQKYLEDIYIIEVLYFNINNTIIKLLLTEVIIISVVIL